VSEDTKPEGTVPSPVKPTVDAPPATWEAIFEHPRFKGLLDEKKTLATKLADIEAEKAKTEQEKLAKAEEWQKLADLLKTEKANLEAQIEALKTGEALRKKREAIKAAALAHDPPFSEAAAEDAYLFIELDKLEDNPKAVAAAVKALAAARAYMLAPAKRKDPGSPGVSGHAGSLTEQEKEAKAYKVRF